MFISPSNTAPRGGLSVSLKLKLHRFAASAGRGGRMPRAAHQALVLILDMAKPDGSLCMSQKCLGDMMGVCTRTVMRGLDWLRCQGFLATVRRRRRSSLLKLQLGVLELAARHGFAFVRGKVRAGIDRARDAAGRFSLDVTIRAAAIHRGFEERAAWSVPAPAGAALLNAVTRLEARVRW